MVDLTDGRPRSEPLDHQDRNPAEDESRRDHRNALVQDRLDVIRCQRRSDDRREKCDEEHEREPAGLRSRRQPGHNVQDLADTAT